MGSTTFLSYYVPSITDVVSENRKTKRVHRWRKSKAAKEQSTCRAREGLKVKESEEEGEPHFFFWIHVCVWFQSSFWFLIYGISLLFGEPHFFLKFFRTNWFFKQLKKTEENVTFLFSTKKWEKPNFGAWGITYKDSHCCSWSLCCRLSFCILPSFSFFPRFSFSFSAFNLVLSAFLHFLVFGFHKSSFLYTND